MKMFTILAVILFLAGCSTARQERPRNSGASEFSTELAPSGENSTTRSASPVAPVAPVPAEAYAAPASPIASSDELVILPDAVPPGSEVAILPESPVRIAPRPAYYETRFDADDDGRATNIALAAAAIDGATVAAGEEFSFNATVGSTIGERGYKKAIVFADGKKTEGYGGGVCQVSTTLCNAAIAAGMTIIERHNHSLPVFYVGDGVEAATSQNGRLDFRFRNEKEHPVTIRAEANNGVVWVILEDGDEAPFRRGHE